MRPSSVLVLDEKATYAEITHMLGCEHIAHKQLRTLRTCAENGAMFMLYRGRSSDVMCVLPGGGTHVVPVDLRHMETERDRLYVQCYDRS